MNLKHKRQMKTFDELFEKALRYGSIPVPENPAHKEAMKSQYNFAFNVWLQDKKGWKHGNESQYTKLLTKENWKEFLTYEKRIERKRIREFENAKSSWQIAHPRQEETKQLKKKKDTRLWLSSLFDESEKTKQPYTSFQKEIETHGCFVVNTDTDSVKVYTPELAVILTSQELPVRNMDTKKETKLNGWEYLQTYIEAYKEGEQYFEAEYKTSPDTLYGVNAEKYVRDIHLNFFHIQHAGANKGWGYVKKQHPITLTHKLIKEYGYYSGIVNKVEEQVKKYPKLFATFEKCEHNLAPQQSETKTDKLKAELSKYGFFELPKVKLLTEPNKQSLIELISANGLPYSIAMFDFLGFLKHIESEHFNTKYKLNREVAKWFDSDKEGRAVKGNISSLVEYSKADKRRYTAHTHKAAVKTDYNTLK